MSDDDSNNNPRTPEHNNPAVERFKQGSGRQTLPAYDSTTKSDVRESTSATPGGRTDTENDPVVDAAGSVSPSDDGEHTGPAPADQSAASRGESGKPLFYDNPIDAENTRKVSRGPSMFDRMKSALQQNNDDTPSGDGNIFQRLAARAKTMAADQAKRGRSKELGEGETQETDDFDTPIEAQSSREARKERKALEKQRKTRQKSPNSKAGPVENDKGKKPAGKLPRGMAALLIIGIVGVVIYKAGHDIPVVSTLLKGGSPQRIANSSATKTGRTDSRDDDVASDQMPRLADTAQSDRERFDDNASFGDDGMPALGDRDFSNTPDGVEEKVAAVIDAPRNEPGPDQVKDFSTQPVPNAGEFYSQEVAEIPLPDEATATNPADPVDTNVVAAGETNKTSTTTDTAKTQGAKTDSDSTSETVADTNSDDAEPAMPEAVSPNSPDTLATNETSDTKEDGKNKTSADGEAEVASTDESKAPSSEADMAERMHTLEEKFKASERKIAKLEAKPSSSKKRRARPSTAKPDLELLAISIARYCSNCVPLVTVVSDGRTLHLSKGDSFHGFTVNIKGDRLLLVRGDIQYSYYPGS